MAERISGKASPILSPTRGQMLWRNGPSIPSILPWRMALRMILRRTYPRPSLEGRTPSATRKAVARTWSAMTLRLTSDASDFP